MIGEIINMKRILIENIDYIISAPSLPGVPDSAVILECGVGEDFIQKYKLKYKI